MQQNLPIHFEGTIIKIQLSKVTGKSKTPKKVDSSKHKDCTGCEELVCLVQKLYDENLALRKKCHNKNRRHATIGRPHIGKTQDFLTKEDFVSEKRSLFRNLKKYIKKS